MMGNVWEWMEDSTGVMRGGSYVSDETYLSSSHRYDYNLLYESTNVGFRPVEVVPEPATMGLLGIGALVTLLFRRHFLD